MRVASSFVTGAPDTVADFERLVGEEGKRLPLFEAASAADRREIPLPMRKVEAWLEEQEKQA